MISEDLNAGCDAAWNDISDAFGLNGNTIKEDYTETKIGGLSHSTVTFIMEQDILIEVLDYLQTEMEMELRNKVVPKFWKWFVKKENVAGKSDRASTNYSSLSQGTTLEYSEDAFVHGVRELYGSVKRFFHYARRMDDIAAVYDKNSVAARSSGRRKTDFGARTYVELLLLLLKGTLHSQLPSRSDFWSPVQYFYAQAFQVYHIRQEKEITRHHQSTTPNTANTPNIGNGSFTSTILLHDDSSTCSNSSMNHDMDERCEGCHRMSSGDGCECNIIIAVFHEVNRALLEMDLLERLSSDVVAKIVRTKIESHVEETCQGSFTTSHLASLEEWLDRVVMGWVSMLYSSAPLSIPKSNTPHRLQNNDGSGNILTSFRQRMCHFLYETYTRARIEQLFNIIIEFPESQPALEDLRECLAKTDLRGHLTRSLKTVLKKKLLHLGVNTTDIITAYIAAIRALRVLDASGVLLELVCEPVRHYLRTRDDTVRCIVQSLIDDTSSELAEELTKNEGLCLDESIFNEMYDGGYNDPDPDELEATWETWQPDPIDSETHSAYKKGTTGSVAYSQSRRRKTSDIISMLVNIYGSKELFVNEYRSLLSNRLLNQFSYETEKEIRNLELLKLRFGEAPLHQCEVMLKDIGDSKRINSHLYANKEKCGNSESNENLENVRISGQDFLKGNSFDVNAIILSAQFWPQFTAMEKLQLPEVVTKSLERYTKAFEAMKGNRTLVWKTHLGFANIDLQIGKEKKNLTVSPVHAAIIYHFQEKAEWSAEELSLSLKIPMSTLRRRIAFWITQGLIKEVAVDRYALIEEGMSEVEHGDVVAPGEDEEAESVTKSTKNQRAEELEVFWAYIRNMLTNFESLALDRIYQMLKMFAMQPGANNLECTMEELRAFLDTKVRHHDLLFTGGEYKMPKV